MMVSLCLLLLLLTNTTRCPGHSYHFRGKPELLAGISEENLLVQLEIEYQGDITSCNKVENYLQYSEYEYEEYSNSSDSSHVHSEQVQLGKTIV